MSKSHFSLKDVAKEAEVSSTTISRYLNGTLRLPDSTSDRINKAVKKLRYHPNPHARRLSLGKSEQIALILPDLANPFFAKLAASIERAAAEYGAMVSLHATSNKDLRELAALRCAADDRVESLIFMTNRLPSKEVAEELSNFKRVVLLDEDVPGVSAPRLLCDNKMGGVLAGMHLKDLGHHHVAYFGGGRDLLSTQTRLEGLRLGLCNDKVSVPNIALFVGEHSISSGQNLAKEFLDKADQETAIFSGSDEITVGVLEIFEERGIRIPKDFSLISFDNAHSLHLFSPSITSVSQPVEALGHRAVQILSSEAWEQPDHDHIKEIMPVKLIKRNSVVPPANYKKTGKSTNRKTIDTT